MQPTPIQYISEGRASCPWSAFSDTGVEECMACARLVGSDFRTDGWVRCEPPPLLQADRCLLDQYASAIG